MNQPSDILRPGTIALLKPEIGFHVKEESVVYRVRRKPARK
jgi:hypothetical protein